MLEADAMQECGTPRDVVLTLTINHALFSDLAAEAEACQISLERFASEIVECGVAERRMAALTATLSDDDVLVRERRAKPAGYKASGVSLESPHPAPTLARPSALPMPAAVSCS